MNSHNPFDTCQPWGGSYCGNQSNDPLVDKLIGNAYHVVRTVYCNLGNLKLIYDFLQQYGMVLGVQSEAELKALTTEAKYARIYNKTPAGDRQVTDYLYVEGDMSGIVPDDATATGSWIKVATSDNGGNTGSDGDGGYIPWVYNNGSAIGGETSFLVPDETVGVPFIIVGGYMQYVGYGFTYDATTSTVTLAQPLEAGDFVVVLRTGVPANPDNPNISNWVTINWLYNQGAAVGGEQVIDIPYTFQSVPAIYKNGDRYYKGLVDKSYTVDSDNNRIILTEALATNDRLIVSLGGEQNVLEVVDITLQEVARVANVNDSEVILSTNTVSVLNGKTVIFDVTSQKSYGLPTLPTNVYISSVGNGQLTYQPGNVTVTLTDIPHSADELRKELASSSGHLLVPSIQIQNWKDIGDIRGWGAVEGQDCTAALQAAINERSALSWGTSSDVIINGNYKIEGQVILTTDVRLIGNWATITSTSNDFIFVSGWKDGTGTVVPNITGYTDDEIVYNTRLKGTVIKGITFVGVAKVFKLWGFTERCGMEDLVFENCGVCWDTRLSFYPYYSNILIRGVKVGYEDWFAYQLRHQCNQVTFTKVTVSGRKYGELIADDAEPTVMPPIGKNCQHINHIDCTYEGVTKAVVASIKTIGYTNKGIYAEVVADNMFEFTTVEHYDVVIEPRWFAGVEKMGHFNNLRGNSKIWQGMQYDYVPAKRSALQFGDSIVTVYPAQEMLSYEPVSTMDSGIAFDGTSKVRMPRMRLTSDDVPVWDDNVNFARCPVTISGFIPHIDGKAIGVTAASYDQATDVLTLNTDIHWSVSNLVLVALQVYQTSNTVNRFNSTGIVMNGFASQFAGQGISYDNVGGLTVVKIAQPGGPSGSSWMTSGDYTVEGCIRLL